MKVLRVIATYLSGPLLLMGSVWTLQGVGILPGSFMTGRIFWAVVGVPMAALGVLLAWWVNRPNRWTVLAVSLGMILATVWLYFALARRL